MYEKQTKEMEQFIDCLKTKSLTIDEIQQHPIIQNALNKASVLDTSLINTPERDTLRTEIVSQLLNMGSSDLTGTVFAGEVAKEKRAEIVIGLPASGKSTALCNPLSYSNKARIIDSDMAKKMLPEYDGGFGANAVHVESKAIFDSVFEQSLQRGDNIILPIVGSKKEKVQALIEQIKQAGYTVGLHLCDVATDEAVRRCALRFAHTGRFLPLKKIINYGGKPVETYEQLKDYCHRQSRYDNNGIEKILIEKAEMDKPKNEQLSSTIANQKDYVKYPLMRPEVITKKRADSRAYCLYVPITSDFSSERKDCWVSSSQVKVESRDGKAYVTAISKQGAMKSEYLTRSLQVQFARNKKEQTANKSKEDILE